MNKTVIAIVVTLLWSAICGWSGYKWRDMKADTAIAQKDAEITASQAQAEAVVREAEKRQATAAQAAGDSADAKREQIEAEYQERIDAAVADRDSELGRVRKLWGQCETDSLSDAAASAAAVAEQDRLRNASAARIVRAVELAQSERDEAIDRYLAIGREG